MKNEAMTLARHRAHDLGVGSEGESDVVGFAGEAGADGERRADEVQHRREDQTLVKGGPPADAAVHFVERGQRRSVRRRLDLRCRGEIRGDVARCHDQIHRRGRNGLRRGRLRVTLPPRPQQ